MIPKIIHQTWRTRDLPENFARWSAAWKALHPRWRYVLYDDADIDRIVRERAPQYADAFFALPRVIQRIDMFRYLVVWLDGGLYADLDMIPFKASDPLIEGQSCVLSVEHHFRPARQKELRMKRPFQLQNCIFAAEPGHVFFKELLDRIVEIASSPIARDDDVEDTTGPRMLTRLAFDLPRERLGDIKVVPEIVWSAPWQYPRIGPIGANIYARHASTGTWRQDERPFLTRWRNRTPLPNPFETVGPTLP
jgi:inositol phosphorylceramide mannosyltransferase catalytic subunit